MYLTDGCNDNESFQPQLSKNGNWYLASLLGVNLDVFSARNHHHHLK
jgi:hypothetical protein